MTNTNNKILNATRNALLAFVLITIGFALGKEAATRRLATDALDDSTTQRTDFVGDIEDATTVRVYYAHATIRCVTCNTIEALALKTLQSRFPEALAEGTLEWRIVNFLEDDNFARRYEIVASTIVVVGLKGGTETGYARLDEVWTKVNDPRAFEEYVTEKVRRFLPEKKEPAA